MKKLYVILFFIVVTIQSSAQNSYLGEIRLFAGNFAPKGWAKCEGQTMIVRQYSALFSILGTQYGGDGMNNFKLPDFRGKTAIGTSGNTQMGSYFGTETTTLTTLNLPPHSHIATLTTSQLDASAHTPDASSVLAPNQIVVNNVSYPMNTFNTNAANTALATTTTAASGSSTPINVSQPALVLTYIICIEGIFPPRQ